MLHNSQVDQSSSHWESLLGQGSQFPEGSELIQSGILPWDKDEAAPQFPSNSQVDQS